MESWENTLNFVFFLSMKIHLLIMAMMWQWWWFLIGSIKVVFSVLKIKNQKRNKICHYVSVENLFKNFLKFLALCVATHQFSVCGVVCLFEEWIWWTTTTTTNGTIWMNSYQINGGVKIGACVYLEWWMKSLSFWLKYFIDWCLLEKIWKISWEFSPGIFFPGNFPFFQFQFFIPGKTNKQKIIN